MRLSKKFKVKNELGLHTRPATQIVKILEAFQSSVYFTYKKDTINARSIMSILILAVSKNSQITVTVEGEDALDVMDSLVQFFEEGKQEV